MSGALDTRLICEKTCAEMRIIMYTYTEEKKFTKEQVQELFLSINWVSGNYPERLYRALMNSSTVLTVWDGERLVGLIRVLDDTAMLAQIHYVIVHPDYQEKVLHVPDIRLTLNRGQKELVHQSRLRLKKMCGLAPIL